MGNQILTKSVLLKFQGGRGIQEGKKVSNMASLWGHIVTVGIGSQILVLKQSRRNVEWLNSEEMNFK